MPQPPFPVLHHEFPVPLAAPRPERLAPPDHDQEDGRARHADEGGGDEAVLVAEVLDPGCYPTSLLSIYYRSWIDIVHETELTRIQSQTTWYSAPE